MTSGIEARKAKDDDKQAKSLVQRFMKVREARG
jgi:hypothetical protein